MKKVSEIMEELGFNPQGSDEVKKAFIKNLIKQAQVSEFSRDVTSPEKKTSPEKNDPDKYQQISLFDQKLSG